MRRARTAASAWAAVHCGWMRLRAMLRRRRLEEQLDQELRFHLEMATEQNLERGMGPEQARRAALRSFGGVAKIKEECRDSWGVQHADALRQDLRQGARGLLRNPGFTAVIGLTLALGIGANTAIFSLIHGVLLRSLPYGGGDRLVRLYQSSTQFEQFGFSVQEVQDYRELNRTLDELVEYHTMWFVLLGGEEPRRVQTGVVSANFFAVLGVRPLLGRTFLPHDEAPQAEAVLVLSHGFWVSGLGADPEVVGRRFEMNDRPHRVIGVLPPLPQYPDQNDVYMPTSACPFRSAPNLVANRAARLMSVFGRLQRDATVEQARTDLQQVSQQLQQAHPGFYPAGSGYTSTLEPLRDELVQGARPTFFMLLAAVGLVLLIACANVANLTLARLIRREHELALRSALGATRSRLVRQLLTESTLLALLGGVAGLLFAYIGLDLLVAFAARFTPRAAEIAIDGWVLLFSLVLSIGSGLAFGLAPALSARPDLRAALQESGGPALSGAGRLRLRRLLVVTQVTVAFVLLVAAGLLMRSLLELQQVDPGFQVERILTMRVDLNFTRYRGSALSREFHRRLLQQLESLPDALAVGAAGTFPLNEVTPGRGTYEVEGDPLGADAARPVADFQSVSPDYFRAIGVPILRGRFFTDRDGPDAPAVAIVSSSLARRHWGDKDPIGRRIALDGGGAWVMVVGVVGDVRQYGLDQQAADGIYLPIFQAPLLATTYLVRSRVEPARLIAQIKEAVYQLDPTQPVDHFRTLEQVRHNALAPPRLTTLLLGLFAAVALALTAAGIAGVIAFSVSQRTREIGIRMALGATQGQVVTQELRRSMAPVLLGLGLGSAGAIAVSRLLAGLLYGIPPTDPTTYLLVALLIAAVATGAGLIPAYRLTAIDPLNALRRN